MITTLKFRSFVLSNLVPVTEGPCLGNPSVSSKEDVLCSETSSTQKSGTAGGLNPVSVNFSWGVYLRVLVPSLLLCNSRCLDNRFPSRLFCRSLSAPPCFFFTSSPKTTQVPKLACGGAHPSLTPPPKAKIMQWMTRNEEVQNQDLKGTNRPTWRVSGIPHELWF